MTRRFAQVARLVVRHSAPVKLRGSSMPPGWARARPWAFFGPPASSRHAGRFCSLMGFGFAQERPVIAKSGDLPPCHQPRTATSSLDEIHGSIRRSKKCFTRRWRPRSRLMIARAVGTLVRIDLRASRDRRDSRQGLLHHPLRVRFGFPLPHFLSVAELDQSSAAPPSCCRSTTAMSSTRSPASRGTPRTRALLRGARLRPRRRSRH